MSYLTHARLVWLIFLLTVPDALLAADFTGKVVGISDGYNLTALHIVTAEKVRLCR